MKNKYYPTIGLEIHIVLNTKTRMFSPSLSSHDSGVNNHLNEIDVALPGTMPSLNENALKKAITLAHALHMKINYDPITFDRKSYWYWDLPKGFQITQQENPIGEDGYVVLDDENSTKIAIERIQMEEDTAKQMKAENGNNLLLNYNRSGMPLIEIVSKPVMHNSKEVELYLQALREIFIFMNISDAKMQDGSMRVDVNISLSKDLNTLGTKVEIKNINSISNAAQAVEYEIKRQSEILDGNNLVQQETRRFDDTTNTTIFMRTKVDAVDYRYMTEPNILAIHTPKSFVDDVLNNLPKTPLEIREELKDANLSVKDINSLMSDKKLYEVFTKSYEITKNYKDAERWILNELMGILNSNNETIIDLGPDKEEELFIFVNDYNDKKFNSKQAKDLFHKVFGEKKNYKEEANNVLNNKKTYTDDEIAAMVNKLLEENPEIKNDLKNRPEKADKFISGSIMKMTDGQVDPAQLKKIIKNIK